MLCGRDVSPMGKSQILLLSMTVMLLCGCHSTVTKPQLYAQARRLRTAVPQGQMIHEGSDSKYDYYRFEPGGQRFKVLRNPNAP
jgi:hypothetical protein